MSGDQAGPVHEIGLDEIAAALFARRGIESGLWRLAAKLTFAGISAELHGKDGTPPAAPAGLVAFTGLALFPVSEPGSLVFDAAKTVAGAATSKQRSRGKKTEAPRPTKKLRGT